MLKLIHTSDWHLGQNFYGYDRSEEQKDFLDQLTDIVRKHTPDALLVSGDIFHTPAPSNAAVNLYVNAMLDIHKACPSMVIVVIAGNHDSASRLDSDKRLWQLAGVRVLGSIGRDKDGKADLGSHLVKIDGKGVIAAVPFAYPASFPLLPGVDEMGRGERQQAYFQALLDHAVAQGHDELPVVLMAHLAIADSDLMGHDRDMKLEWVDLATLGTGYDYAALGHIHRPQDVSERVRYCGTPVPVSFDEQCEHSVSIVEIDGHGALPRVETRVIKNLKPLHTLPPHEAVDFETALQQLQALNPNDRSYIRLNVKVDQFLPTGAQEQAAQAVKDKQCRFCEIKKTATMPIARAAAMMTVEEFNRKTPLDIAKQYFINKYGLPMDEQLQEMFTQVYESVKEEIRK